MTRIKFTGAQHVAFWAGWIGFGLVLAGVLHVKPGMPALNAIYFGIGISGIAQLSAWSAVFSCKTAPLSRTPMWRLVLTHLTAAVLLTLLWMHFTTFLAKVMDTVPGWQGTATYVNFRAGLIFGAGLFYYLLSVAINYALIAQKESLKAQELAVESGMRAREAELAALKAQINPHFLYNSLNSISALTSIDPARAREMCVSLADFLRMTLGMGEKGVIPLGEELRLLEKYCAIEKVRFGDRLVLKEDVEESLKKCLLPPLLLQPLFENAVVHGIAQMPEGGWIRLKAEREGERLSLLVENSWDPEAGSSRRNGVGLKNVQRRLEARYGDKAQLEASAEENVFRVKLQFPAEEELKA
ncbi:MAG TPA: histidine kinase [Candidatus Saccharimonadales bacterium]|nr:histidine kinase [Candidatus Saccharimonadales bacterium]